MAKRNGETPNLTIEKTKIPTLKDDHFGTRTKYTKGTPQLTTIHFSVEHVATSEKNMGSEEIKDWLEWQGYSELQEDHGFSLMYEIFFTNRASGSDMRNTATMSAKIAESMNSAELQRFRKILATFGNDNERKAIYIQAVWAQLFAERFEELWLASMAQHAYYIAEDDFAFGYLTALLDQKRNNETHFLRGKKSVESAKLDGQTSSVFWKAPEISKICSLGGQPPFAAVARESCLTVEADTRGHDRLFPKC